MPPTPAAPKGGQKSAPEPIVVKSPPGPLPDMGKPGPVVFVPSPDRIPTPDGVNVAEVMKATAAIDREKALALARRTRHMSTCPTTRNQECACPANLHQDIKALESKKFGSVELVRVDEGFETTRTIPDPQSPRNGTVKVPHFVLPRWICLSCGWSARATGFNGHACDETMLIFKAKPLPLSATISVEKRSAGGYRLTIWKDPEGKYHLGEAVIEGNTVVSQQELSVDPFYPSIEGELSDKLISEFET